MWWVKALKSSYIYGTPNRVALGHTLGNQLIENGR
jgi:hypothetical protein